MMPEYRVYCLDSGGRFCNVTELEREDDAAALEAARTLTPAGRQAEVWQRARLVGRVAGTRMRTTVAATTSSTLSASAPV
jgi:hypothetical protein